MRRNRKTDELVVWRRIFFQSHWSSVLERMQKVLNNTQAYSQSHHPLVNNEAFLLTWFRELYIFAFFLHVAMLVGSTAGYGCHCWVSVSGTSSGNSTLHQLWFQLANLTIAANQNHLLDQWYETISCISNIFVLNLT